jgi:hypothetical protein
MNCCLVPYVIHLDEIRQKPSLHGWFFVVSQTDVLFGINKKSCSCVSYQLQGDHLLMGQIIRTKNMFLMPLQQKNIFYSMHVFLATIHKEQKFLLVDTKIIGSETRGKRNPRWVPFFILNIIRV